MVSVLNGGISTPKMTHNVDNNLQIIEALKQSGGFLSQAAKKLKVTQASLCLMVKKSDTLQEAITYIVDAQLDLAESQLIKLISDGNLSAIKYYLDNKGEMRGYGKQFQNSNGLTEENNDQMKNTIETAVDNLSDDVKTTLIQTMLNADISINGSKTQLTVEKNGSSENENEYDE